MEKPKDYENIASVEQKVTIQMITVGVAIIVVILTLVSFIHIYSSKKEQVLKDMRIEAEQLETVITDHLNYSKYFINIISRHIQNDYHNLEHILKTLRDHFKSQDFNMLFGWRKYSWIDENFLEIVTSTEGIMQEPRQINYIKDIIGSTKINNTNWKNKIVFYNRKKQGEGDSNSLKIIDNISDKTSEQYVGSVVLSYDINTMTRSLNMRKKNKSTNFVILDKSLEIVAQSKPIIQNLTNQDSGLIAQLNAYLKQLSLQQDKQADFVYLDMINGLNYFVSPLKDLPFILIVNIDNDVIQKDIISDITKSFISVCIFASLSLFAIIFIYKRETFLRTKAEKASLVAENATRAKTNFLAFTAHEIRSPLSFILTGSEIMLKELIGKLPDEYKKYAQGIHENSKVILDFITDILDENQIIEGKFKIINNIHRIEPVIQEAIQVNLARFYKRKVAVVDQLDDDLPFLICDRRRIVQVLSNLISNSIKYSADCTTITVSAKIIHGEMVITVMDQGFGMEEHEVPIALSAYGTLREPQDYYSTGSYGLGLAIVKMLLDAHDAELRLTSVKGKGTTVKMIFPKYKLVYTDHTNKK